MGWERFPLYFLFIFLNSYTFEVISMFFKSKSNRMHEVKACKETRRELFKFKTNAK